MTQQSTSVVEGDRPLVSVVTPTLNRRSQLDEVIRCVQDQTYRPIEHIVVDGGSTDGTLELLQQRALESDVLRWISEPDEGVYSAVNKGLSLARGDVVAYLNTDDRYFSYSVETAVRALARDGAGAFVFGDLLRLDVGTHRCELLFYPPFRLGSIVRGQLLSQPTVFWRRDATERIGVLDETLGLAADMEYWVRLGSSYGGSRVDEVLALEAVHSARLTSGVAAARRAHAELAEIEARYDARGAWPRFILRFLDRAHASFWDRWLRLRFWRAVSSKGSTRYAGFRPSEHFLGLSARHLLLSLVPRLGTSHRARTVFVDARSWPALAELSEKGSETPERPVGQARG